MYTLNEMLHTLDAMRNASCISLGGACSQDEALGMSCCASMDCIRPQATSSNFSCACKKGLSYWESADECRYTLPGYAIFLITFTSAFVFTIAVLCTVRYFRDRPGGLPDSTSGTLRQIGPEEFSVSVVDAPSPSAEQLGPTSQRSRLHNLLMFGIDEGPQVPQTIIDAFDFPPEYPGSPVEELPPPSYEEAFNLELMNR